MSAPTIYVFGSFHGSGHLCRTVQGTIALRQVPVKVAEAVDADLRPPVGQAPDPQIEGTLAHSVKVSGWSAVTWWDRKGDVRRDSHTGIIAKGDFTPAELIALGREKAPWAFRVDVDVLSMMAADNLH